MATLTPTQRRRFRKQRATARYYWHQIRTGSRPGTSATLSWILKTLGGHHSRDPAFLQRVQTARSKILAMESGRQGWKCVHCRIMNKKNAEYCQKCGGYWTECHEGEKPIVDLDGLLRQPKLSASKQQCKASFQAQPLKRKGGGEKTQVPKGRVLGKESSAKGNTGKNASSPFAYVPTSNTMAPWPILDFEQFQQAPATPHSSAATGQSIYTGFGFGSQESISRVCLDPTGPSGGHGKGRELWQSPDYQRPPRCDISPGTGQERTPGGSRCKSQVEGILDEAPAGEPACMGVSIGLLQNEHGQASR